MLTADQQRFLRTNYRTHTADALDGGWRLESLRKSAAGGAGKRIGHYDTSPKGIAYSLPGERWHPPMHRITWAQIAGHRDALPQSLRDQLRDVLDRLAAEERRFWDAMHAIRSTMYAGATAEQRENLDTEWSAHTAADRALQDKKWRILDAMLPLGIDEPADLIEWAAVLA